MRIKACRNAFSTDLDRIRGPLVGIHKTDVVCIALALFALAASVPFYAFNRSTENAASFHCQAFFRYVPESITIGLAEKALRLKQVAFLDEGLPSCIWCFSWTLILLTIWRGSCHCRSERIFWCSLPIVLNIAWEVFQAVGVIGGSGTFTDIIFGVAGAMLALSVQKILSFRRKVVL